MKTRSYAWMALGALLLAYSAVHVVLSGIVFPLRAPNVGQVIEELQPMYKQMSLGRAIVDQPRQYGPVFLLVLDPVARATTSRPDLLALYCYFLDVIAIVVGFWATLAAMRHLAEERNQTLPSWAVGALAVLWANFGPLYGILAAKNVELWELALLSVAVLGLIRGWQWTAAFCIAAAGLTKMLPFVFVPYLLIRDRRTFAYTIVAILAITTVAQLVYGTSMGWGYLPDLVRAAGGSTGYGNPVALTWHENVSLKGLITKAFGFLEQPNRAIPNLHYSKGYYVIVVPGFERWASIVGTAVQGAGLLWAAWVLVQRVQARPVFRRLWDWSFIAAMMLVLAPQASHDYMTLTLGAFSFALVVLVLGGGRGWPLFIAATLLVGNVLPRSTFSRLVLIDPIRHVSGFEHLTRVEAYQYFGFPLLGLLLLVDLLVRVRAAKPALSAEPV